MRVTFIILLCTFFVLPIFAQTTWVQVWADEFDYTGKPDPEKWGYDVGGNGFGNNEDQYYTDRIENAYVGNGYLTIESIKETYENREYTSARLTSKNKGDWKYGKFEVMAQIPTGKGAWSAIWMLPTENIYGGWPASGEIDIMENVGYEPNKIYATIHTESYNHKNGTQIGGNISPSNPFNDFHKYTVEWYEDQLVFSYDDVPYFTANKQPGDTYAEWPFDQYFHILLNTAIGGDWGGAQGIDDTMFPKLYKIDYVRVYTLAQDQAQYNFTIEDSEGGTVTSNVSEGAINKNTSVTLTANPDDGYEFVRWKGTYSSFEEFLTFDMQTDVTVIPVFKKIGELIINGNFNNASASWIINNGGTASFTVTDDVLNISNATTKTNAWDIQLQQSPIALIDGHIYRYSYTVSTTDNISITSGVGQNQDPWGTYISNTETVNNETKTLEYTFTMNANDPAARVFFDLGKTVGNYTIDNISLLDLTVITDDNNISGTVAVKVYPNPASETLHISSNNSVSSSYLSDLYGKPVRSFGNSSTLNIAGMPSGIYILHVKTASGDFVQKIVIE